eukprot:279155_1
MTTAFVFCWFVSTVNGRDLSQFEIMPHYLRTSQLVSKPFLSDNDRKSHKFFSTFYAEHNVDDLLSNCTEKYFTQYLDHFSYRHASNGQSTFQQRYFVCGGKNWKPNNTIFFYGGNEADVELYVNATGLMWENADSYDAIMVFAEHRYFGKSLPFGSNEADIKDENIIYLTVDQTLMDYASLIHYLKTEWHSWHSPVIGFGGSYGGALCIWFRIKYPQWSDGCIAGSAPMVNYPGAHPLANYNFFAMGETYDCKQSGGNPNDFCAENIHSSWYIIFNYSNSTIGRKDLAQAFNLCSIPNDYNAAVQLANWVADALGTMSMGSYPYRSDYMLNGDGFLPPYPMRLGCSFLSNDIIDDEMQLLESIRNVVNIFYNYTQNLTCFDINANANNDSQIDGYLMGYLACAGCYGLSGQNGNVTEPYDMFWYSPWNATAHIEWCYSTYGIKTQLLWPEINYGGWAPFTSSSVSNIVFSNGELDPWKGGGVINFNDTEMNIYSIIIPDVGHHIDLMFSNVNDTNAVKNARQFELNQITNWIKTKQNKYNILIGLEK